MMKGQPFLKVYPCFIIEAGVGLVEKEVHILLGMENKNNDRITLAFDEGESKKVIGSMNRMFAKLQTIKQDGTDDFSAWN